MITKIDIERFGLFSNYCWKQHIGTENNHIFSKMNIISQLYTLMYQKSKFSNS